MNLTIDLPDELAAALEAEAMAQGVSLEGFTRRLLEEVVDVQWIRSGRSVVGHHGTPWHTNGIKSAS
jgi:hypothetical protein